MKYLVRIWILFLLIACKNSSKENINSSYKEQELIEVSCRLPIPIVDAAFAPFYLAQDSFFAKYGLKVELKKGNNIENPTTMVGSGIDEFGICGGPELLLTAVDTGLEIKGIALLHKNSNFPCLLTKKSSGITKVSQLEGLKVGFNYNHVSEPVLNALFKKENVHVNKENIQFDYGKLINGNVQAAWAFTTTAAIFLPEESGLEFNMISPKDYGIITHGYTIISSNKFIQSNPKIVIAFLRALIDATNYSLQHEEEAIKAIISRKSDMSESRARKSLALYNQAIKNNSPTGWVSLDDINASKNMLLSLDILSKDFKLSNAFDLTFMHEIYSHKESN